MLRIWNRSTSFILLGAMALFLTFPFFANAEACQCWCSTSSGAISAGTSDSTEDFATDCKSSCEAKNPDSTFLNCYTADEENIAPNENQLCWTEYECTNNTVILSGGSEVNSEWGDEQPPACIAGEKYCYSPLEPIKLSVALGEFTEAGDIGEYVTAGYKYLISAAALIAVVMIMIGGLQYVLALGNATGISKAKERIQNAVIGLALVLSAYTIAFLIDPNLVSFDALRVPLIRTVVFLDPNSTCEVLMDNGIVVEGIEGGSDCGMKGRISSLEDVKEGASVSSIKEGDECIFSYCREFDEVCIGNASAPNGFLCQKCYDSNVLGDGVTPSSSACTQVESALQSRVNLEKPNADIKVMCEFSASLAGGVAQAAAGALDAGYCIRFAYPAQSDIGLDCTLMKQNADVGDKGCGVYEDVRFVSWANDTALFGITGAGHALGFAKDICEKDPCNVSPTGCYHDEEYIDECKNVE
jgi:hypothetical protein